MGVLSTISFLYLLVMSSMGFGFDSIINAVRKKGSEYVRDIMGYGKEVRQHILPSDVCFDHLGCFPMGAPWHTLQRLVPTPQTPEEINTTFTLFTRRRPRKGFPVTKLPKVSLQGADVDGSKMVYVIIHGMGSSSHTDWMKAMKDAFLTKYDCNVFLIDWSKGAKHLNYLKNAANTRVAAAEVARLLTHLIDNYSVTRKRIHLVGHSLGAHVASYVGKRLKGVARITALDPAQPNFENKVKKVRLDKSDANLVEVIHSNARPFVPYLGLGMIGQYGHLDFYMNGGATQPGCIDDTVNTLFSSRVNSLKDLGKSVSSSIGKFVSCSHKRASLYFIASILDTNCNFWGHKIRNPEQWTRDLSSGLKNLSVPEGKCTMKTCCPMGMNSVHCSVRGAFNVITASAKPFCCAKCRSGKPGPRKSGQKAQPGTKYQSGKIQVPRRSPKSRTSLKA